MLSIFSCVRWPYVWPLWRIICLDPLPIFNWIGWFFLMMSWWVLHIFCILILYQIYYLQISLSIQQIAFLSCWWFPLLFKRFLLWWSPEEIPFGLWEAWDEESGVRAKLDPRHTKGRTKRILLEKQQRWSESTFWFQHFPTLSSRECLSFLCVQGSPHYPLN